METAPSRRNDAQNRALSFPSFQQKGGLKPPFKLLKIEIAYF
jgi:hypothetical protein